MQAGQIHYYNGCKIFFFNMVWRLLLSIKNLKFEGDLFIIHEGKVKTLIFLSSENRILSTPAFKRVNLALLNFADV